MHPVVTIVIILSMLLSSLGPMQISTSDITALSESAIAENTQIDSAQALIADWPYPPPGETPTVEPSITETPLPPTATLPPTAEQPYPPPGETQTAEPTVTVTPTATSTVVISPIPQGITLS